VSGRLVDVVADCECAATNFGTDAHALCPSRAFLPRKVRATIDFPRTDVTRGERWRSSR